MVGYTWVAYPFLLKLLSILKSKNGSRQVKSWPSISIVMAVHNEASVIEDSLADLLAMDYPHGELEVVVVSDGSTDATNEIVRSVSSKDSRVRLIELQRSGQTAAIIQGVLAARYEVIVRSDADTRHDKDFLIHIAKHYLDPRIGCVGGELKIRNTSASGISQSEGIYWRYEMLLRRLESDAGVLSTTSGAVMSFRREIFEPFSPDCSEDVVIPKLAIKKGYVMVHEPRAVAYEVMPSSAKGEVNARRRMVSRALRALFSDEGSINPLRHPLHWWAVFSHKVLRWMTPVFLILSFVSSIGLRSNKKIYSLALWLHLVYFSMSLCGFLLEKAGKRVGLLSAAYSFFVANLAFLLGWKDLLLGRKIRTYSSVE